MESKYFLGLFEKLLNAMEERASGPLGGIWQRGGLGILNRAIGRAVPFAARCHFKVVNLKRGYLEAEMPIKGNRNHIGTMYAGALFTLAEIPGGVLALTEFGSGYVPVLKKLNMEYLKPARTEVRVEFQISPGEIERIRTQADEQGKCDFTLTGDLVDRHGEVVARSWAEYQLRKMSS